MEKGLYKTKINCGRQGTLTGLFVKEKVKVEELFKQDFEIYFGEVLGKHSEIYGKLEKEEIQFITDNPEVIRVIEEHNLETGINPFHYTILRATEEFEGLTVDEIIEKILNK
jgi:hypothetical protein